MYFKYGSYQHADSTVDLTQMSAQRMHSPRNRLVFTRWTMYVEGHFCVSGQDNIRTTIQNFEYAYRDDWEDAGLYHDDGTPSAHVLTNANSINGVRVLRVTYPRNEAEYATGRSFQITFQADYMNIEDEIYSFEETLQFLGECGPSWQFVPVSVGEPIFQINHQWTPQRIIQSGSAVGWQAPPLIPGQLLPLELEHVDLRITTRGSAQKIGVHKDVMYPMRYRYVYSSTVPMNRFPRSDYPGR